MNKPVAWMDENENVIFEKNWAYPIPLYTHPVKELTKAEGFALTDEEIEIAKNESTVYKGIYDGYGNGIGQKKEIDYKIFAKAILRKAQEK